jgi:hypothetical protein
MGQESLKHLVNKNSNLKYVFELNWQKNWQIPKVESFPIELNFDLFECEREEQEGWRMTCHPFLTHDPNIRRREGDSSK